MPATKGSVWDFYDIVEVDPSNSKPRKVVCRICGESRASNVTRMQKHMAEKHAQLSSELVVDDPSSPSSTCSSTSGRKRQREISEFCVLPLSEMEKASLRRQEALVLVMSASSHRFLT